MTTYKKESLEKLLTLIKEITNDGDNLWFKEALIKNLDHDSNYNHKTYSNTEKIKEYLNLSPELSIDYSFIKHNILRKRLELDNLRMQNVRLSLNEKDEIKRLYDYIIYSFYQIENLINFYYYHKYPIINNLLNHLESIPYTKFKRSSFHKDISDINISSKIFAFNKTYFSLKGDFTGHNITSIRKIRNEGLHRCHVILKEGDSNSHLFKFLKYSNYDSIHKTLEKLTQKVKNNI